MPRKKFQIVANPALAATSSNGDGAEDKFITDESIKCADDPSSIELASPTLSISTTPEINRNNSTSIKYGGSAGVDVEAGDDRFEMRRWESAASESAFQSSKYHAVVDTSKQTWGEYFREKYYNHAMIGETYIPLKELQISEEKWGTDMIKTVSKDIYNYKSNVPAFTLRDMESKGLTLKGRSTTDIVDGKEVVKERWNLT